MNLVSRQIYGNKKGGFPNTFIGGVASTINTPDLLATKLAIDASRITGFSVVGSDIKCKITGSYVIPNALFKNDGSITHFKDEDGLISSYGSSNSQIFGNCANLKLFKSNSTATFNATQAFWGTITNLEISLPYCTNIVSNAFYCDYWGIRTFYIPRVTNLGSTSADNSVFFVGTVLTGSKIYAHTYLANNNAGAPDGDLAYVISKGVIVRYVTNFIVPNPVTTLSAGTIYNTAIQLNFTPPSSINAIDYYEVYINGIFSKNITASGQLITGLTASTSYSITVIAVDIFLNKSTVSNTLTQLTNNYSYTDTDANAYISAASLTSSEQESAYKLIVDLKSNSLYTKCQAIYPFKGTTASQHKFNAKNPLDTNDAFRLTFTGASTFSNLGYQLNGSSFGNTNLIPSAVLNVNSHGLTIIVGTNNSANSSNVAEIGSYNGESQALSFTSKNNNTLFTRRAYVNTIINLTGTNRANGIFSAVKSTASVSKIYENSAVLLSSSGSGSLPTNSIYIGAVNAGGGAAYSNQRIQMAIIHEGLSDAEVVSLHAVIDLSETIAGRKTW